MHVVVPVEGALPPLVSILVLQFLAKELDKIKKISVCHPRSTQKNHLVRLQEVDVTVGVVVQLFVESPDGLET